MTEKHATPQLKQWTLHTVEVPEGQEQAITEELSKVLRGGTPGNTWYADFKNDAHHYIIFPHKVFFVDRTNKEQYDEAKQYGISIGIPEYQVDFHPEVEQWER